jgi:hypothetical protein
MFLSDAPEIDQLSPSTRMVFCFKSMLLIVPPLSIRISSSTTGEDSEEVPEEIGPVDTASTGICCRLKNTAITANFELLVIRIILENLNTQGRH